MTDSPSLERVLQQQLSLLNKEWALALVRNGQRYTLLYDPRFSLKMVMCTIDTFLAPYLCELITKVEPHTADTLREYSTADTLREYSTADTLREYEYSTADTLREEYRGYRQPT